MLDAFLSKENSLEYILYGSFVQRKSLRTFSAVIQDRLDHFPGNFLSDQPLEKLPCGKYDFFKVRNVVRLRKEQCWPF